ncbi:MAG: nucleoside recognition domain-containing protein [Peptostreptococcaceae bacterium]
MSEKTLSDHQEETFEIRKEVSKGTYFCIIFFTIIGIYFESVMGIGTMFSVIMKTAHDLLLNTAFYIMGVAVLAGALSSVFSEFGVTALINKLISPIMKPIFGLPGASSLGAITCYFSDNPAIIPIAKDPAYAKYFKKYQWATMVNFGTTFGMGIIISGGILGIEAGKYAPSVVIGTICAIIGGIISNRLLMRYAKKLYGADAEVSEEYLDAAIVHVKPGYRKIRSGTPFQRGLNATFDGGKAMIYHLIGGLCAGIIANYLHNFIFMIL